MTASSPPRPAPFSTRTRSTACLGFGGEDGQAKEASGIRAIIDSALVSYERLPMLEVVFDRLVRMMSTSLRNFTSDNVEVSIDSITSIRFGDYLNSIPLPAMLSVFKAEEWDNHGLLTIDSALIYSIVDVLLGGRRGTAAMRIEGRPYTTIERNLVERLVAVVLADLSGAFDPLSPVNFRFDRLETNPRFATIGRPANAAVLARLRIDMEDRGGRLEVLLPYATLEPVREILLQGFLGEKFGRDSIWEAHLAGELWHTHVPIQAILDTVEMSLRQVLEWQVGTRISPECVGRFRRAARLRRSADVHRPDGAQGRQHRRPRQREDREGNILMMLSLFGDAVVALLLVATISYAAVLNRRLGVLRGDRAKLEELVQGLTVAAQRAEAGISALKATAEDGGKRLESKIEEAQQPARRPDLPARARRRHRRSARRHHPRAARRRETRSARAQTRAENRFAATRRAAARSGGGGRGRSAAQSRGLARRTRPAARSRRTLAMVPRPRLLPSVIIAASALLAVKAVDLWSGGSAAIAAARAETGETAPQAAAPAGGDAAPPTAAPAPAAAAKPQRDPLQMSPEEIDELQQLSARRVELDKREAELSEREVLMQAAEKRIDDKIAKLQALDKSIQGAVKQRDDEEDARVQSLAHMYEQMKPQEAARILDQLDVPVLLTMLAHIREMKAAPILAAMDPAKAKAVTLALTEQRNEHAAPAAQTPAQAASAPAASPRPGNQN